jgi:hypothetical protein
MPSVKFPLNVMCWNCDHFQAYGRNHDVLFRCSGECRKNPPGDRQEGNLDVGDYSIINQWPLIDDSVYQWCVRWERSGQSDLADPWENEGKPGTCEENPESLSVAHDAFWLWPWNKKIEPGYVDSPEKGICCWNCDHFQPSSPGESSAGLCHAYPPGRYQILGIQGETGQTVGYFPGITNGLCAWCGQWERARRPVSDPAPDGWVVCPISPPE